MTTVVSTCLEKWEFLKFVIIWKAETWLQTQESEYCTSLHCTTLQCNRYKRPAPGQNFNSPQLPPNYYCYPSFVLWTFGDHEQNEQNELTTILHTNLYWLGLILFWSCLSALNSWWLNLGRYFHFGSSSKECAKSLPLFDIEHPPFCT